MPKPPRIEPSGDVVARVLGDSGLMDSSIVTMMHGVRGCFRFAHIAQRVGADVLLGAEV